MAEIDEPRSETGFEFKGRFYRWTVTDMGKDLMLIDRISGLPIIDFFEAIDDEHERQRGPILLTLIACSLRAGNPDWSVDRIVRTVMALSLAEDVEFVGGDDDEEEMRPPPKSNATESSSSEPSRSPSNGSSSSSTQEESADSSTSFASPV